MAKLTKKDILALRESINIEFKSSSTKLPASFWETYSAFANTEGGDIILGVLENGKGGDIEIHGVKDPLAMRQEIFNLANNSQKLSCNLLTDQSIEEYTINNVVVLYVHVPKAPRQSRPVYLKGNPMYSYVRMNEGDYKMPEHTIHKILAERVETSRDAAVLKGYSLEDLDQNSLNEYRNNFAFTKPNHPFLQQDTLGFLTSIGAWGKNREDNTEGLTIAGLLMFGKLRPILDAIPHYIIDYQELPNDQQATRWIDRFTTDGSWSGNLYDFYNRVYNKLTAGLKVPFKLVGNVRQDETPIHEALREALVNIIIHADYHTGRISLLVEKHPNMFRFRNPGLMRIPKEQAIKGGESDCRNRNLQKMFQFIGAGEQAGSGMPRIYQNWQQQHWHIPKISESYDPEQTILELHTVSLLSNDILDSLDRRFSNFKELTKLQQLILATAATENKVDHKRIRELASEHPADLSKAFSSLVKKGFLEVNGIGRGATYTLTELSHQLSNKTMAKPRRNEPYKKVNYTESQITQLAKNHQKLPKAMMYDLIIELCSLKPRTLDQLASLLHRDPTFLRTDYIKELLYSGKLALLYKEANHPKQAYTVPTSGFQSLENNN
jgi:ATP-dependent DNA helicase RecG